MPPVLDEQGKPLTGQPVVGPEDEDLAEELENDFEEEVVAELNVDEVTEESDDDDAGSAPETYEQDPEAEPEVLVKPRVSRSQERIRSLANQNRELQQQLEIQRAQAQHQQRQDQQRRQQEEYQAWYETLDPSQRYYEDLRVNQLRVQNDVQTLRAQLADDHDRNTFRAYLADNPRLKPYESKVEELYKKVRAEGVFASRDLILNQVIGAAMREQKGKPVKREVANKRVQASKTKPPVVGSDTPRGGRRAAPDSIEAIEARLRNKVF